MWLEGRVQPRKSGYPKPPFVEFGTRNVLLQEKRPYESFFSFHLADHGVERVLAA